MSMSLSKNEFVLLKNYIEQCSGIHISDDKEYLVHSRLTEIMKNEKIDSYGMLCHKVIVNGDLVLSQKIIDAMTTNETFWFRDRGTWTLFMEKLMPEYVKALSKSITLRIKIWSCACSTGQEPYTMAMLIHEYFKKNRLDTSWANRFSILATDISERALNIAIQGVYGEEMMDRGLDPVFKRTYFQPSNQAGKWMVREELKRMISFEPLNLKNMFYFDEKDFHLIFIRNVLIYFNDDLKNQILNKISTLMLHNGILVIGASELIQNQNFERNELRGNVYYQLSNKK